MKKKFALSEVDCANCAAKMEEAIKKLDGVNDASVSFMTQKMNVEFADGADILEELIALLHRLQRQDGLKQHIILLIPQFWINQFPLLLLCFLSLIL